MTTVGSLVRKEAIISAETRTGPEVSERVLLDRARDGDTSAFEQIYRRHSGRIHGLLLRMVGNSTQTAEELTQEVFLRAWQKLDTLRADTRLGAWLHRVAVNLVINERRRWARRGNSVVPLHPEVEPQDDRPGPQPVLRRELEHAIAELPQGARDVLLLYDVYGYRHDEIAGMTGRAVGTTKAQLHRARRRLREVLGR